MNLFLSNTVVRAYKKKDGYISLNLKTHLITDCGWDFHNDYIREMNASCIFPNGHHEKFKWSRRIDREIDFDGIHNAISVDLQAVTSFKRIDECIIKVHFILGLEFSHTNDEVKQLGVIKKMYFGE